MAKHQRTKLMTDTDLDELRVNEDPDFLDMYCRQMIDAQKEHWQELHKLHNRLVYLTWGDDQVSADYLLGRLDRIEKELDKI